MAQQQPPVRPTSLCSVGTTVDGRIASGNPGADRPPGYTAPRAATAGRVLVVEDSQLNQEVAVGILERLGYEASVVGDGRSALAALEQNCYDAVLMDCQMPEMDGFEASAEIRRREGDARHTPIIAMTAHAMKGDRERCLAAGMDDYLSKPLFIKVLATTLHRWAPPREAAPATSQHGAARVGGASAGDDGDATRPILDEALLARLPASRAAAALAAFERAAPRRLADLRAALANHDAALLRRSAHTLKGEASLLGAHDLQSACVRLEAATRDDETLADAAELVGAVDRALARTLRALEQRSPTCAS